MSYEIVRETPSVDVYLGLRRAAGLGKKSVEAAERGLPNTIFGVQVFHKGQPVGIARLVGDGGCHYQAVDVAVLPEHQGHGLGKLLVGEITRHFRETAPPGAYLMSVTPVPELGWANGYEILPAPEVAMFTWQRMD